MAREFNEQPAGTVLRQPPAEGIVVERGGTVDLVVSSGVEMTIVPGEVIGRPRQEAEALLGQAKLTVQDVVPQDGNVPEGRVLGITPAPGTQVRTGTPVVLTVASGLIEVPDVRGRSESEAVEALRAAGFSVGIERRPDPGAPGRVLAQSPVNRRAGRGSTVTIAVSQTPPPEPVRTAEPAPTAPAAPAQPSATPSPAA